MDLQAFLLIMLSLLTINAIVVGVYVVFLLREFSHTLKKVNEIVDDVKSLATNVSRPVSTIADFAEGLTSGFKFLNIFRSQRRRHE